MSERRADRRAGRRTGPAWRKEGFYLPKIVRTAVVVVIASGALTTSAGAAFAEGAPTGAGPQLDGQIDAATIQAHAVNLANAPTSVQQFANAFIEQQAGLGVLVDAAGVMVATLPSPLDGTEIIEIWDGNVQPQDIWLSTQDYTAGAESSSGFGVDYAEACATAGTLGLTEGSGGNISVPTLVNSGSLPPPNLTCPQSTIPNSSVPVATTEVTGVADPSGPVIGGGLGASSATSHPGMYLYSNACVQSFWDPHYPSSQDDAATTCFQKFAQSGTNRWAYNRWATFTAAKPSYGQMRINDFTIRSRPWKGYESQVVGMNDYQPKGGSSSCEQVSLTIAWGALSLTAPQYTCSQNFIVYPNASKMSMGAERDNGPVNIRQEDLDFSLMFAASNTKVAPPYADYTWATTQWGGCETCNAYLWSVSRIDSGW